MRSERFFAIRVALIVKEHIPGGLLRRHFAKINRRRFTVFGPQHHKSAAANITGLWMRDRQRIAHRHRGIDGVTALTQNIHPDAGCHRIHRGNHPLPGTNRVKDIFFNTIRNGRRGGICADGKTSAGQQSSDDHLTPGTRVYHCLTPEVFFSPLKPG